MERVLFSEWVSKGERGEKWERNISSLPRDQQAFSINSILDTQPEDGIFFMVSIFLSEHTYNQYPVFFHHSLLLILPDAFQKGHLELIHLKSVEPKHKLHTGSCGHGYQKWKISLRLNIDLLTNNNFVSWKHIPVP